MQSSHSLSAGAGVLHIENDPLWAKVTGQLLELWPEVYRLGTATNGEEGIGLCRTLQPNIVILDLVLPDMSGLAVWDELQTLTQQPKILLLTARADEAMLHRLVLGDAAGVVRKRADFDGDLRLALATIIDGSNYFPSDVSQALRQFRSSPDAFHKLLSPWELRLVALLARGYKDSDIAGETELSQGTIRNHWHIIGRKLGLRGRHDLRAWAEAKGFASESKLIANARSIES